MLTLGGVRDFLQLGLELRLGHDLAEDRGVRTFGHALHAADAVLAVEQRNLGRDVGEVAQHAGAGGDERPQGRSVGGQAEFGGAVVVSTNDAFVEVLHVEDVVGDGNAIDAVGCRSFKRRRHEVFG